MIYYKVVTQDRYSCVIPKNSEYVLRYKKGAFVKALPNSLGIFIFKSRSLAEQWIIARGNLTLKILRVESTTACRRPRFISWSEYFLSSFYRLRKNHKSMANAKSDCIPEGTICCREVKVLD